MTTTDALLFQADMLLELNQTKKISVSKLSEFKVAYSATDDVRGMILPLIMIMEQRYDNQDLMAALEEVAKVFVGIDVAKYTVLIQYIQKNRYGEYALEDYEEALAGIEGNAVNNVYLQIAVETEKLRMYLALKDYANVSIASTNLRTLQSTRDATYGQVIMYGEL